MWCGGKEWAKAIEIVVKLPSGKPKGDFCVVKGVVWVEKNIVGYF